MIFPMVLQLTELS